MIEIHGTCDPAFEPVREAFASNFEDRDEVGAALCVYQDGEPVIDIWGGIARLDDETPWERDTLCLMDSSTKAITAICALMLVEAGELELDRPVVDYWPEFGQAGKQDIPVRLLFTHQVGLPAIDQWLTMDDIEAWTPIVDAIARQRLFWEPGSAHGYHGLTIGWLLGELIRRISGLRPGAFLRERIAARLGGIDTWIGLPQELEPRVAHTIRADWGEAMLGVDSGNERYDAFLQEITSLYVNPAFLEQYMNPEKRTDEIFKPDSPYTIAHRAFGPVEVGDDSDSRRAHAVELPAANGISDARSIARIYAALMGEVDGVRLIGEQLLDEATHCYADGPDELVKIHTRWGLGFVLPGSEFFPPNAAPHSFGHPGANGALAYADRDSRIALGYLRNHQLTGFPDPHTEPLLEALNGCARVAA
jgi:CubicO group peptidase (beta-lactamase class C family)